MVTPRREVLRVPSGASAHFGRTAAWHERAASGAWHELPNSVFSAAGVGWPNGRTSIASGAPTNFDFTGIVLAWGGGVLNTAGVLHAGQFIPGTFLVLFGGGHNDYAGNELYAYGPLHSESPSWRRLTDPAIPPADDVRRTAGGQPVSRHTYDSLVYLPSVNKMIAFGSPGSFRTGNDAGGAELFDFATSTWQQQDAGFESTGAWAGNGTINCFSGYDSSTGKAWIWGNGNMTKLMSYSETSGQWFGRTRDNPVAGSNQKGGLSPSLGLLVHANSVGQVSVLNLRNTPQPMFLATTTGSPPADLDGRQTLEWHEGYQAFVCFDADGALFLLTPGLNPLAGGDPWIWSKRPNVGASIPALSTSWGTFGRWRRVPAGHGMPSGMLLMRHSSSPILFLKD